MSHKLNESELEVIRESILKFYEAVNAVITDLENLKYFTLRMAMASDLSGARLYLDHAEANMRDLQRHYKELLERFEDLKSLVTDPQKRSIRGMWRSAEWECVFDEEMRQK